MFDGQYTEYEDDEQTFTLYGINIYLLSKYSIKIYFRILR